MTPRSTLDARWESAPLGLDEVALWSHTPRAGTTDVRSSELDTKTSRTLYAEALQLEALALVSVSLGALEHRLSVIEEHQEHLLSLAGEKT